MAAGGMPISVGKSHRYSLPSEVVRSRQTYMAIKCLRRHTPMNLPNRSCCRLKITYCCHIRELELGQVGSIPQLNIMVGCSKRDGKSGLINMGVGIFLGNLGSVKRRGGRLNFGVGKIYGYFCGKLNG
jgi:hypothetical protein